jgi:citrate lyase subunit beta / citryl-CoA lyase
MIAPAELFGPSLLFCPGDRPERFGKAAAKSDVVIIDLEDAVAPADKPAAREALVSAVLDPETTIVRVNSRGSGEQEEDLRALRGTGIRTVILSKAESLEDLPPLAGLGVIALCESPLGIRNAELLADHPSVIGLIWGSEDLVAGLAGSSSRSANGQFRGAIEYSRGRVLVAAASAGKPAYDTAHLNIADLEGLALEAEDSASSGFAGKACIHPVQVEVVRSAFRPSPERVAWAHRVLAASGSERGAFRFEGRMIDAPILQQARRVLAAAQRTGYAERSTWVESVARETSILAEPGE